jgi:hypothetical protein
MFPILCSAVLVHLAAAAHFFKVLAHLGNAHIAAVLWIRSREGCCCSYGAAVGAPFANKGNVARRSLHCAWKHSYLTPLTSWGGIGKGEMPRGQLDRLGQAGLAVAQ